MVSIKADDESAASVDPRQTKQNVERIFDLGKYAGWFVIVPGAAYAVSKGSSSIALALAGLSLGSGNATFLAKDMASSDFDFRSNFDLEKVDQVASKGKYVGFVAGAAGAICISNENT